MLRQTVLFNGINARGNSSLWETDGTAAGTQEFAVNGAGTGAAGSGFFFPVISRSLTERYSSPLLTPAATAAYGYQRNTARHA